MKWYKHFSTAMDDLFIMDLERRFSHLGYAFWFKTLELMGSQGTGGKLVISWANYLQKLRARRSTVDQLLASCRDHGKLVLEDMGETVVIEIPKFEEFASDYVKYDGMTRKRLLRHTKQASAMSQDRIEVEEKKKYIGEPEFSLVWKRYPKRDGRAAALKHFLATVKTDSELAQINQALTNYLKSDRVKNNFVKNGSTWFNDWREWIEPTDAMMKGATNGKATMNLMPDQTKLWTCPDCHEKFPPMQEWAHYGTENCKARR